MAVRLLESPPPRPPRPEGERDFLPTPPFEDTPFVGERIPFRQPPPTDKRPAPPTGPGGRRAPGDFSAFIARDLSSVVPSYNGSTPETAVAIHDQIAVVTGNWYAAVSRDAGQSFAYLDPYAAFPSANGGFCCDQVALYEPSRDLLVWRLQYIADATGNTLRLAVSRGLSAQSSPYFTYWDFTPQALGFPAGYWFDFGEVGMGANTLYMSTNVFTSTPQFAANVTFGIPLDQLAAGGTINYDYFDQSDVGSYLPSQGVGTTMYFLSHPSNSGVRILRWSEGDPNVYWYDISVTPFQNGGGVCTDPGGVNWCEYADARMGAGWRTSYGGGGIGAMWNSAQGGPFAYPYVQIAVFRESDYALLAENFIWSPSYAWHYPSAGINARGDLSGTIAVGGGAEYVDSQAWIWDDINGHVFQPLENYQLVTGTGSTDQPRWGDFFTTRAHSRWSNSWNTVAVAPTAAGGSDPIFYWMGRERDLPPYPFNDYCYAPSLVALVPNAPVTVVDDSSYAVFENSPSSVCASVNRTLWYEFTAPAGGTVTVETCGGASFDTVVALWQGGTCPVSSSLACNDDFCGLQSRITAPVISGQTYQVMVGSYNGSGYALGGPVTTTFTFVPPGVSVADTLVREGNVGSRLARFDVSLSEPLSQIATVDYITADGTAAAGSDYVPLAGTLSFAPATTRLPVWVSVLGDTSVEGNETFTLNLSSPVGVGLLDGQAICSLIDDDGTGDRYASELVHGSDQRSDLATLPGPLEHRNWYPIAQKPHSSYEVVVDGASGDLGTGAGPALERVLGDGSVVQDSLPAGAGAARVLRFENSTAEEITAEFVRVRSLSCALNCDLADVYRLRIYDTTYLIARFSNAGGQSTLLVLQNGTDAYLDGHIWFWSTAGTLLAAEPFTAAPSASLVLNTAALPGVAGQTGSITLSQDGPYGGLVGKAVAYEPATGFTFDTPLVPRPR